jgi:transposase
MRCPVPELVRRELVTQLEGLPTLTARITDLKRQIGSWQRREVECQRLAAIPGVGRLTATAVVATVGDARSFRSGREFAAFLGLVPQQSGSGGRVKLLGISKRGDPYLRTLLIHGARTVLTTQSRVDLDLDPWLKRAALTTTRRTLRLWRSRTRWHGRSGRSWLTVGRLIGAGAGLRSPSRRCPNPTGGTSKRVEQVAFS